MKGVGMPEGRRRCWCQAVAIERRRESWKGAGEEEMASKCTYSALEGSGWPGVHEGMGSKCGGAVEWTGGESKVAEQPLLQPSHWTLEQKASNVGRCLFQRTTYPGGKRLKWAWAWALKEFKKV